MILSNQKYLLNGLILYIILPFFYLQLSLSGRYHNDFLLAFGCFMLGRATAKEYLFSLYPENESQNHSRINEYIFYLVCNLLGILYYTIHSDALIKPWYLALTILLGFALGYKEIKNIEKKIAENPPTKEELEKIEKMKKNSEFF